MTTPTPRTDAIATAFVAGHPIGHSRSPVIHRHWLDEHGLQGAYETRDVAPNALEMWLEALDPRDGPGGNVTVPHKEAVRRWLGSRVDEAAREIGAVNTLWFESGALWGGNTDAYGFAANLDHHAPAWEQADHALVIGAGGAARAVVHALKTAGIRRIEVANRTLARAESLVEEFGLARAWTLEDVATPLRDADLVVNTASLGMVGAASAETSSYGDPSNFNPNAIATDIVYAPLDTPFLQTARMAGCRTVDGLGMLLHQAAPGFERWFGVRPQVTPALRRAVERTL